MWDAMDGADQPMAGRVAARVAAVVLVLIGLANAVFGVLALTTGLVRLPVPTAGTLVVLGLATAALGVLVGRGARWALVAALWVFGALFVVQGTRAAVAEHPGDTLPGLVTLTVVILPLLLAHRTR